MNSSRREKYIINRRERQSKARQAQFINEYIQYKYFAIYREAAQFYNQINTLYPTKRDLRKCGEFKRWKMSLNGVSESSIQLVQHRTRNSVRSNGYYIHRHANIPLDCKTIVHPESPAEQSFDPTTVHPESPAEQSFLSTTAHPESPAEQTFDQTTAHPESPAEQSFDSTTAHPESPAEQSFDSTTAHPESPVVQQGKKIMQLNIPLLEPSVITQTLHLVTQETLQEEGNPLQVAAEEIVLTEGTLYPSLVDEIPSEVIERIIDQLRQDPGLKNIMDDIEQNTEFEQLGMDLELPEDRLENELYCEFL